MVPKGMAFEQFSKKGIDFEHFALKVYCFFRHVLEFGILFTGNYFLCVLL